MHLGLYKTRPLPPIYSKTTVIQGIRQAVNAKQPFEYRLALVARKYRVEYAQCKKALDYYDKLSKTDKKYVLNMFGYNPGTFIKELS